MPMNRKINQVLLSTREHLLKLKNLLKQIYNKTFLNDNFELKHEIKQILPASQLKDVFQLLLTKLHSFIRSLDPLTSTNMLGHKTSTWATLNKLVHSLF